VPVWGRGDLSKEEQRLEHTERELIRRQRIQFSRVTKFIRLADFMAILMVLATAFTAFATWRTAQVTSMIFAVTDRPFIGVQTVKFEAQESSAPIVVVDFRNFGHIPATDAIVNVDALIDGKAVKQDGDEMSSVDQGVVSPGVPHFFYTFVSSEQYKQIVAGAARLMVRVKVEYKGPGRVNSYCYFEKIVYDFRTASFRHAGGADRCRNTDVY
jgi:hypothetical protein